MTTKNNVKKVRKILVFVLGAFVGMMSIFLISAYAWVRFERYYGFGNDYDFSHRVCYGVKKFFSDLKYLGKDNKISVIGYKYVGNVTSEKRYLSIGFDDFRDSDL